LKVKHVATTT